MKCVLQKWDFIINREQEWKRKTLNQSLTSKSVMDEIIDTDSEKAVNQTKITGLQEKGRHGKGPITPSSSQALVFPYA